MLQKYRETIDNWLSNQSEKPKLIVIYGPTACGKTGLSIDVAEYLQSEIISVDSRQIYRGLDIGTGKVTEGEKRGIRHHMLDIIDPTEKFSVVDYRYRVEKLDIWKNFYSSQEVSEWNSRNKIPLAPLHGESPTFFKGEFKPPIL
jgi:tRNA A37 N6-isopentenylltransferase MiaA